MTNGPVLLFSGSQHAPGIDPVLADRHEGWVNESYIPLRLSVPGSLGADRYGIVVPRPEYPIALVTYHIANTDLALKSRDHPDRIALVKDIKTWIDRGAIQFLWGHYYELINGFRNESGRVFPRQETMVEGASFLHLEGYRMSPEDQTKYEKWLGEWGFNVVIPLVAKLTGVKAFNCYKTLATGGSIISTREQEYPQFVNTVYFEDQNGFEGYTKSPEFLSFQKAIGNVFPSGLNYKWWVQYQLVRSWRK